MKYEELFEPYTFKNGVTVKNRIVIPPMTEASSFYDGTISTDELEYFKKRGGQTGLFIAPAAYIMPSGKGFEGQLSVSDDRFIPRLSEMAKNMQQNETKAIIQLFHAGRLTNSRILRGGSVTAPSAVPSERSGSETPHRLGEEEIENIIDNFADATRRAIFAGFDGIELHGAGGYLLSEFFSPHANRRSDKWGGSLNKRMTFIIQLVDRINQTIKKYTKKPFIFGYRFSPEEISNPGFRINDTLRLVDVLSNLPLDYLHVSQRYVWRRSSVPELADESLIVKIQRVVNGRVPLIGVGSIATPDQAVNVIQSGLDFVALGRELLIDPDWVTKVKQGHESEIDYSISEKSIKQRAINPAMWKYITTNPNDDPRNLFKDIDHFWK
ncbi:NADH-dependent flavin oxidoreductase [Companilactobacillus farciminis]|uniref:NADH-dependent flavin oxidoreductase n=1 Tax=Companilactobacillus farciminis TaxID=1612 RepID=UPI0023303D6A|nr:NADH-dependent flavin oxidoreductase [Companilactobacillus farciminis]WCG34845.1 NADH-dependent flavin oxidoreductase [Companilactobacillus farciminis]